MLGLRKKLVAAAASLALIGLPLAAGGAAFAATSTTGGSSTAATTTTTGGASTAAATTTTPAATAANGVGYTNVSFSDVTTSTPHYNSILELAALGLVSGYPDGTYQPATNVTRAEFAKLIDIALGLQSAATGDTGSSNFSDVPAGQWYTGYVNVAAARGIVNGYPNGTFLPNAPVQYDEAVTMVVRALGYAANVVGSWPSGYLAEASNIQNSAQQYTLLSGLSDQTNQPLERADVARLINNMLYAVPASQQFRLTNGSTEVVTSGPTAATQAAQLGFNLYYPGNTQSGAPLSDCYGNVVTGTILTNPALNPNQVQITSLSGGSCGHSPVVAPGSANTYTLAPTVALVGGTSLMQMTGYQVSFATNNQGQIVYIGAVTPSSDALTGATLGSQLTITNVNGMGQLPSGISQISLEPASASAYQSFNVAAGAVAVPTSGVFKGSNGSNDTVTAVLNPNGDVIALIDSSQLTQYKDVYLTGVTTLNGVQTLQFYDGSVSNTSLGIAAGAAVTIDGSAAALTSLKPGMILNIAVNSQSQATSIAASDKTITGSISNVTIETGNTYVDINGSQYEVRLPGATYAEAGAPVSALDASTLNGLSNNTGTVYIGVDNYVGYIDVTNSNTVVGMALNPAQCTGSSCTGNAVLEVETGNGGVTAYPLYADQTIYVQAGDIVRLTLNAANGAATVEDYSNYTGGAGGVTYGTAAEPALVTGVLGNEIQVKPGTASGAGTGGTLDLYVPSNTPVFQGTGGGAYLVSNLTAANAGGSIASTASTTTLATIQPGYYVTIGAGATSALVKGIVYLSGAPAGQTSVTSINNTVDVGVVTAATASSGQLGTANVAPVGATTPLSVSVESTNPSNTSLGMDAGTNNSVFQMTMIGQTLVTSVTASPADLSTDGVSNTLQFSGLATATGSAPVLGSPAFTTNDGQQYLYGSGTVVLNIPDNQIEPIGSLIPGQTVIVYYQTLPSAPGARFAQFVEVTNTATNTTSTTVTGTAGAGVTLNGISATPIGATVAGTVYGWVYTGAYDVYLVSGQALQNGAAVDNGTVTVSVAPATAGQANVDGLSAAAPPATTTAAPASFVQVTTDSGGNFSAYLTVPQAGTTPPDPGIAENVTATYAGTTSTAQAAPLN